MDRLTRTLLGDDEEKYKQVAKELVSLRQWQQKINTEIFSDFIGQTRSEFDEWKEKKIQSYKSCVVAYENLEYSDYGKNFMCF